MNVPLRNTAGRRPRRALIILLFVVSGLLSATGLAACGDQPAATPTSGLQPGLTSGSTTATNGAGEAVFARYCASCHPGGNRGAGPSLKRENFSADEIADTVRNGRGRMPRFSESAITDDQLKALVEYVQSLRQ